MRSIKTLHITNFYHASSGGIRTFYRALLEAANQQKRHVRVVVPGSQDSVEEVGQFGRVYTIAAPRSRLFDSRYRLLLPHLYALPYDSKLRRILRQERPDLVEICDKYTLCFLPSVLRRRWIAGSTPSAFVGLSCERLDDNVSAFLSSGALGRVFSAWYMRSIYGPRFDCHISCSDYTATEISEALAKRPDVPVHVRSMGVSCDTLSPNRRAASRRGTLLTALLGSAAPPDTARLLLYVGRISREKNIPLLLEMMEVLARDSSGGHHLLVAGMGPLASWFAEIAKAKVPGRVHLLGHIHDREQLADLYANCDVLVHPNPREPFGIAPLEAMASGLPVVAPDAGGVLAYAHFGNSWLARPEGDSFAAAVRDVFVDAVARQTKIDRALLTAAEFSWPRVTSQYFALYDDVYRRSRKRYRTERLGWHNETRDAVREDSAAR
jgi:alpha-1,6-mannosyltransferase